MSGRVLFKPYDFQKEIVEVCDKNRFSIFTISRQQGKTITVAAFLLHQALFQRDMTIGILANNAAKSREILSRIQMMYEELPDWIKPGVLEWNKGSVKFSNGSVMFAGPTTKSAIRGYSVNIVYCDEFGFVDNDEEFFTSTYPVISSGSKTKIIITSTPNGMNLFYKLWTDAINKRNGFAYRLFTWKDHPHRDKEWKKETLKNMSRRQFSQEFDCVDYFTEITLREDGVIMTMPIGEFHDNNVERLNDMAEQHGFVYKITRDDGLEYIGTTVDMNKRLYQHKRHPRFRDNKIIDVIVLFEGTYYDCLKQEKGFIDYYDTYKNGLNVTPSGGALNHGSEKFNTLGFKYSDKSRQIMKESWKKRNSENWKNPMKGILYHD